VKRRGCGEVPHVLDSMPPSRLVRGSITHQLAGRKPKKNEAKQNETRAGWREKSEKMRRRGSETDTGESTLNKGKNKIRS